jgi:hypothetical protein
MAPGRADVVEVSGGESPDDRAGQIVRAVFEFMEEIRPKAGVFGPELLGTLPPYEYRLGATRRPALTVREILPSWEPPLPRFGPSVAPSGLLPVRTDTEQQEIPGAFRRR